MFAADLSWLLEVVRPTLDNGPGPLIDDDLAYVAPWGGDPTRIRVPGGRRSNATKPPVWTTTRSSHPQTVTRWALWIVTAYAEGDPMGLLETVMTEGGGPVPPGSSGSDRRPRRSSL
jgi:hypothetical protein